MKPDKQYTNIKYQISRDSKILFVGTNPSPGSYYRTIPFSSNKSFWYLLHDAGLVSENRQELQDDKKLKKIFTEKFTKIYHLGLINLIYRPTKTVLELKQEEAIPGNARLLTAIKYYKPTIVCFVGKTAFQLFAQTSYCHYGWQPTIGSSKIFVMHSPIHGLAKTRINELIKIGKAAHLL